MIIRPKIMHVSMIEHPNAKRYSYEVKVGACADYLLGKPLAYITHKWGMSHNIVSYWIKQRKCFKLRRNRS